MENGERNYNVTNKIFSVLNDIKGFDVAVGNPKSGKIIVGYNGDSYILSLMPIYKEKSTNETKDFSTVVEENRRFFKK